MLPAACPPHSSHPEPFKSVSHNVPPALKTLSAPVSPRAEHKVLSVAHTLGCPNQGTPRAKGVLLVPRGHSRNRGGAASREASAPCLCSLLPLLCPHCPLGFLAVHATTSPLLWGSGLAVPPAGMLPPSTQTPAKLSPHVLHISGHMSLFR